MRRRAPSGKRGGGERLENTPQQQRLALRPAAATATLPRVPPRPGPGLTRAVPSAVPSRAVAVSPGDRARPRVSSALTSFDIKTQSRSPCRCASARGQQRLVPAAPGDWGLPHSRAPWPCPSSAPAQPAPPSTGRGPWPRARPPPPAWWEGAGTALLGAAALPTFYLGSLGAVQGSGVRQRVQHHLPVREGHGQQAQPAHLRVLRDDTGAQRGATVPCPGRPGFSEDVQKPRGKPRAAPRARGPAAAHPPAWQRRAAPRRRWGRTSCPRRSRGRWRWRRPVRLCR